MRLDTEYLKEQMIEYFTWCATESFTQGDSTFEQFQENMELVESIETMEHDEIMAWWSVVQDLIDT